MIEWLDESSGSGEDHEVVNVGKTWSRTSIVVLASVALVLGSWLISAVGYRSDRELNVVPAESAVPVDAEDPAPRSEIPPSINPPGVVVIATRHHQGAAVRIEMPRPSEGPSEIRISELQGMSDFAVDAGGRWLAATSINRQTESEVLWLGPIDGELDPVAAGIQGFAWHDTEPGQLGFISREADGETFQRLDLNERRPRPQEMGDFNGRLHLWGDWGSVGSSSRTGSWFDVMSPDGTKVLEQYQGVAAGYAPGIGLIVSPWGSKGQPVAIDPISGQTNLIPWLGDAQYVWNLDANELGYVAALVSNLDEHRHEVLIVGPDGVERERIRAIGGSSALGWSADSSRLLYVRDDFRDQTSLVIYRTDTDTTQEWTLNSLDPVEHWTRVVAELAG